MIFSITAGILGLHCEIAQCKIARIFFFNIGHIAYAFPKTQVVSSDNIHFDRCSLHEKKVFLSDSVARHYIFSREIILKFNVWSTSKSLLTEDG